MSTAVPNRSPLAADTSARHNGTTARPKPESAIPVQSKKDTTCLLCGEQHLEEVDRIPTARLVTDWRTTFEIDISAELKGLDEIVRLRCRRCEFEFFAPGDLTGSGEFYEALQRFDWYYMPNKWEHQVSLPMVKPGDHVLEVGCAEGSFLQSVSEQRQAHATGLELNQHAVNVAQQAGLDVRDQLIESFATTSNTQFDFVCAFQVLEHVAHPASFLEACLRVTKPGGRVVFGVPNEDSFLQHQWTLLNMPPHHVSLWKASTFERLANAHPVSIESIQCEPLAPYHIDQYLAAYTRHYRGKSPLHRLLFSRNLRKLYRSVMRAGWHRRLKGQSLLVVMRKDEC